MNTPEDIETATARVIADFIEEGFLFTALDVSNVVKEKLPGVRHREVAPIVRSIYESGAFGDEYTRSEITVEAGGKSVVALLYHSDDDDPEDYAGSQRRLQATPPRSD